MAEDKGKAAECYRMAAENGNVTAMCNLGYCYYTGIGVTVNNTEAVKWFTKAADRGQPRALFLLGECYEEGHGVRADLAQAREFYQRAADKGYQSAQEALQRLDSQADTAPGAYDYKPPQGQEKFREKPKKGGLFGFFKK